MLTLHIKLKYRRGGNWIINLSVLLYNSSIIVSQSCDSNNDTNNKLPSTWPCQWNNGDIPFVFDYFALSPKRLMSLVRKAHSYIEARSCLVFKEQDPVDTARRENFTYLFYSYSEVLESCCLPFFTKPVGRRLVLVTPLCSLQAEVAHTTIHALGLVHPKYDSFADYKARAVMFPTNCVDMEDKIELFNNVVF